MLLALTAYYYTTVIVNIQYRTYSAQFLPPVEHSLPKAALSQIFI